MLVFPHYSNSWKYNYIKTRYFLIVLFYTKRNKIYFVRNHASCFARKRIKNDSTCFSVKRYFLGKLLSYMLKRTSERCNQRFWHKTNEYLTHCFFFVSESTQYTCRGPHPRTASCNSSFARLKFLIILVNTKSNKPKMKISPWISMSIWISKSIPVLRTVQSNTTINFEKIVGIKMLCFRFYW